ncbi:MAG: tRNA lysidine(34) synthetase TilS [Polyangiaceae bacterium]|nr:tRNA lysidine(34) synthetase TilS [Polyangiaceae bacterium]
MRNRGSHGPSLIRLAEREIKNEALIERGMVVLVGVSGGPDSMALMHVLSMLRGKFGFELVAHTVNHGLRDEAQSECELVREQAMRFGVSVGSTLLDLEPGGNMQARARDARHAALRDAAEACGAVRIALGHHAQDRAETVLQRIIRGAGPAGLAVMPPRAESLIRPLIRARRSDVVSHLDRHGVPYASDPSNEDRHYLRARVRCELLPVLESMSPRVVEHLCNLADDLCALSLPKSSLGRAQLRELGRAMWRGERGVRVSLPGGKIATVDIDSGRIILENPVEGKGSLKPGFGCRGAADCEVSAVHGIEIDDGRPVL